MEGVCVSTCVRVCCGGGWVCLCAEGALPAFGTPGCHLRSPQCGVTHELPCSIPQPPYGAWSRLGLRGDPPSCYWSLAFLIPSRPRAGSSWETEKQDLSPRRTGTEGRGGEHSEHAGPCLQTLQEGAGCLGQEGFLEIFSSSESILTSKMKAFGGWQASFCGPCPAGTGKGVGAKGTVLR